MLHQRSLTTLALTLALSSSVLADTITVGQGGGFDYTRIQSGINAAFNGDKIKVYPGSYNENINFLGKSIKVFSKDGSSNTIIDGQNTGSVVTFDSGENRNAQLEGFTIQNGSGDSLLNSDHLGGGILIIGSSPELLDCVVKDNEADYGGGICVYDAAEPYIEKCTIEKN